ncbi:MAG TPA: hypothetical protein VIH99_04585, partial [Bdellovibrionota bacterium]
SKSDQDPSIFLPHIYGPDGTDLDGRRLVLCDPSKVDFRDNFLTQENFWAMFRCANYDEKMNSLEPLFHSAEFPEFLRSVNLVLKAEDTKGIKEVLSEWLEEGPEGRSRADRLLPVLANVIKNESFQAFLPVFSNILKAGDKIWPDLLPGLAEVVYTESHPDNIQHVFTLFRSFSGNESEDGKAGSKEKDYAKGVKEFMHFLDSDVDGKKAALRALELADAVKDITPQGTSFYQFLDEFNERGGLSSFLTDTSALRGEVVDPKLNQTPDPANVACPGLNETPEQRQECAYDRLFQRTNGGQGDAPYVQLAGMIAELQKDHPELLTSLASWYASNGPRVSKGLTGYAMRGLVSKSISLATGLNVGTYLKEYASRHQLNLTTPVNAGQLADFLKTAFSSSDFTTWLGEVVPRINRNSFGEKNAELLRGAPIASDVAVLYNLPEIAAFAQQVLPDNGSRPLGESINRFANRHRRDELQVPFHGETQNVEKHLSDIWTEGAQANIGEDLALKYLVQATQSLAMDLANDFKNQGKPFSEWFYTSPYGNPSSMESILGYAINELGLLDKYYKNKDWLMNGFADEVFGDNADDKRAFRMLIEQVPNIVLYVRSGMNRSGGDLTRALARGTDGYLIKTYVKLVVKVSETGWLRKAVRLIEAYNQRPGGVKRAKARIVAQDIDGWRERQKGVGALIEILRSLVEPDRKNDYETTTLRRLMVPFSSIVDEPRRPETERFLLTSAREVYNLSDEKINDFFRDLNDTDLPGGAVTRRETYKSISETLQNRNFPDLIRHLSGLFQDQAVQPALDFLAKKIDDGSLPKALLFIRRILGFEKRG